MFYSILSPIARYLQKILVSVTVGDFYLVLSALFSVKSMSIVAHEKLDFTASENARHSKAGI